MPDRHLSPNRRARRLTIWLALLLAAACDSPAELDDRWADPATIQFAAALQVDLGQMTKTGSGLYWRDLALGEGDTAKVGDQVRVHLTGWLPDGTEVQTTRGGEPIDFKLGYGLVIRGFDEGIVGMSIGGTRQLVVRPELAFGRMGRPADGIPPLATLVYQVERRPPIAQ